MLGSNSPKLRYNLCGTQSCHPIAGKYLSLRYNRNLNENWVVPYRTDHTKKYENKYLFSCVRLFSVQPQDVFFTLICGYQPTSRVYTAIYCVEHVKQWHRPPGLNRYRWCEQRSEKSNKENNRLVRPAVSRLFKESAAVFMCLPDITPPFENGLCNKSVFCSSFVL